MKGAPHSFPAPFRDERGVPVGGGLRGTVCEEGATAVELFMAGDGDIADTTLGAVAGTCTTGGGGGLAPAALEFTDPMGAAAAAVGTAADGVVAAAAAAAVGAAAGAEPLELLLLDAGDAAPDPVQHNRRLSAWRRGRLHQVHTTAP